MNPDAPEGNRTSHHSVLVSSSTSTRSFSLAVISCSAWPSKSHCTTYFLTMVASSLCCGLTGELVADSVGLLAFVIGGLGKGRVGIFDWLGASISSCLCFSADDEAVVSGPTGGECLVGGGGARRWDLPGSELVSACSLGSGDEAGSAFVGSCGMVGSDFFGSWGTTGSDFLGS